MSFKAKGRGCAVVTCTCTMIETYGSCRFLGCLGPWRCYKEEQLYLKGSTVPLRLVMKFHENVKDCHACGTAQGSPYNKVYRQ